MAAAVPELPYELVMERDAVTDANLLVFPPNGLPLDLEKGFNKEWTRVSQHVIHHFNDPKTQTTYNPHSTTDIDNRITIGQSAFKKLNTYALSELEAAIKTKLKDEKGIVIGSLKTEQDFVKLFNTMKSQFEKDNEGHESVLNDILELVVSTIHQMKWKKDAVKKFCNHYQVTFHGELDKQGNKGASNHCFLNIVNGAAVRIFQNNYQSAMDKVFDCSFRAKKDGRTEHKFGWGGLDIKEEFRRSTRSADVALVRYKSTNAPFMVQPESTTKKLDKSYNTAVSTLAKVAVKLLHPANKVELDVKNKMNELIAKSVLNINNTLPLPSVPHTHHLPPTMAASASALSSSISSNNAPQLSSAMAASTTTALASFASNNAHLNVGNMYSSFPTFQQPPPQYYPPPPLLHQQMAHQPANTTGAFGANQVSTGVVHQQQDMERQQAALKTAEELRAEQEAIKTAEELRAGQEALETSLALNAEQEAGAAEEVDKTAEALREGQEELRRQEQQVTAAKDLGGEEQEPEGEKEQQQDEAAQNKEQQQDEAAKNKSSALSASTEDFLAENKAEATESTTESSIATVPKASTNNVGTKSSSDDEDAGTKLSSKDEAPSKVTFNKGDNVVGKFGSDDDYVWYSGKVTTGRKKGMYCFVM